MLNEKGKLGLRDTTTILIGGMVGSAIFSLSGVTIMNAGPASIISWIVAGIILFAYGLQTAELSTIYPQSGGIFTFPAKALGKKEETGKFWGWISAWAYIFGCIAGAAFSATYVANYLGGIFPGIGDLAILGIPLPTVIALAAILICGIMNIINLSVMGKINTILTVGLALTMIVFIVFGFSSGKWDGKLLTPFFSQGAEGSWGFMGAIPIAMVAFGSIVAAAFMVGEIKNPKKTVPKAMAIAMVVVLVLYVLMIVTTLGLITSGYLQEQAQQFNFGVVYAPVASAVSVIGSMPWLGVVVSIAAVLALLTTILVVMLLAGRALQASAAGGILPKVLAKNSKVTNVPVNAQIIVILVVGVLAAIPNATNFIVNFGSLCNAVVVAIICLTVIAARRKNAGLTDKFTAPGGNVLPIITLIVIIAAYVPGVIQGGYMLWVWTAVYLVVGIIIFFLGAPSRRSASKAQIKSGDISA